MLINIAAIVPIHNGLETTKKFLISYHRSLEASSFKDCCTLIIVNDGSTDGSMEWISEFYPETRIIRGDGDLWWSASINLALRHIQDETFTHFLLFNNDNILDKNYFQNLHRAIDKIGNDKIISSKVINTFPTEHVIYGGISYDRNRSKYVLNKDPQAPVVVNTAGGMGVLVPLNVIDEVGLFDAINFPQKSGDTDFFLRADKKGVRVYYYPDLVVYNDNRISGYSDNTAIHGIRNAYSFPKGYMNILIDLKLFLRHGNYFWGVYRVIKSNVIFLCTGITKIIKSHLKNTFKLFNVLILWII